MEKSKVYLFFSVLTPKEKTAFKKWIISPYANQREDVLSFFKFLFSKKYLNEKNTDKQKIFKAVYPTKKYDDLLFRHLMSHSVQSIEHFFIHHLLDTDIISSRLFLIKNLAIHQLDKFALMQIQQHKSILQQDVVFNIEYFKQRIQIEELDFNIQSKNKRDYLFNLPTIFDAINEQTSYLYLKYACLALTHQQLSNTHYQMPLLSAILEFVKLNFNKVTIVNQLYYTIYQALTNDENENQIYTLRELLSKTNNKLEHDELRDIYLLTINQCIKKVNSGNLVFATVAYSLYKDTITHNLLLQNNEIDRFAFTNIVFTGLIEKDYVGVELFIKEYADYLPVVYKENTVSFAYARLFYASKKYNKAIKVLLQTEFNDVLLGLSARLLLTKIYIETKDYDLAETHIVSFKKYLNRNKTIGYHKERLNKFLNYCNLLLQNTTAKQKKSLQEKIRSDETLIEKDWLMKII